MPPCTLHPSSSTTHQTSNHFVLVRVISYRKYKNSYPQYKEYQTNPTKTVTCTPSLPNLVPYQVNFRTQNKAERVPSPVISSHLISSSRHHPTSASDKDHKQTGEDKESHHIPHQHNIFCAPYLIHPSTVEHQTNKETNILAPVHYLNITSSHKQRQLSPFIHTVRQILHTNSELNL